MANNKPPVLSSTELEAPQLHLNGQSHVVPSLGGNLAKGLVLTHNGLAVSATGGQRSQAEWPHGLHPKYSSLHCKRDTSLADPKSSPSPHLLFHTRAHQTLVQRANIIDFAEYTVSITTAHQPLAARSSHGQQETMRLATFHSNFTYGHWHEFHVIFNVTKDFSFQSLKKAMW